MHKYIMKAEEKKTVTYLFASSFTQQHAYKHLAHRLRQEIHDKQGFSDHGNKKGKINPPSVTPISIVPFT